MIRLPVYVHATSPFLNRTARQEVLFSSHEKPQKTQRGLRPQPIGQSGDAETQVTEKLVTEKWEQEKYFHSAQQTVRV